MSDKKDEQPEAENTSADTSGTPVEAAEDGPRTDDAEASAEPVDAAKLEAEPSEDEVFDDAEDEVSDGGAKTGTPAEDVVATEHDDHAELKKAADHAVHDEHDEHGRPLAARVLRGLFLIAVGCAVALWGAPKLAPLLPQGMAPVAAFLMPGQSEAKAEVAALRSELDARLAELTSQPADKTSQTAIDRSIAALDKKLTASLDQLRDQMGATDGQDIESRLSQIETGYQGVAAELAAVGERLSMQITENGAALSEEAAAKLSGYQAVIEGLKARVDDLAAKNGALSQKIDEIAAASSRRIQKAEQDASARVASTATNKLITDITSALDSGASFQSALDGLTNITNITPPVALADISATGTASWATLRGQYSEVAHAALRADTQANAGDGVLGKFGTFLKTQVGTRSLERKEGDSTDAILSRVEDELVRGNLSASLGQANALSEAPKSAIADWLAALNRLSAAQTALAQLSSTLGAVN